MCLDYLVCSRPWIGRKRPWTWFRLLLNNYWNKKSEFSSVLGWVYFNCFSNLTFQDDYWQTVKEVCRPKATVPGYAVRRWPGSKNHNVSMTGKAGEAEGSPRLMITSTHTNHQKKKWRKWRSEAADLKENKVIDCSLGIKRLHFFSLYDTIENCFRKGSQRRSYCEPQNREALNMSCLGEPRLQHSRLSETELEFQL